MTPEIRFDPLTDQHAPSRIVEEQASGPWLVSQNQRSRKLFWLAVLMLVWVTVVGSIAFAIWRIRPATEPKITFDKYQQIGLALSNFRLVREQPPSDSFDASGKPLLSWRVHLLPFLGQETLYRQFELDEPWDSPSNIQLLSFMPAVYRSAKEENSESNRTFIRAFSSAGSIMDAMKSQKPKGSLKDLGIEQKRFSETQITDGEENTIFAIESGDPVEWTKPEAIPLRIEDPLPTFGGNRQTTDFFLITLDGTVLRMSKSISPVQLKAMITIAGGETFDFDDRNGVIVVKNLREPIQK